jgi:hypothetical protein
MVQAVSRSAIVTTSVKDRKPFEIRLTGTKLGHLESMIKSSWTNALVRIASYA